MYCPGGMPLDENLVPMRRSNIPIGKSERGGEESVLKWERQNLVTRDALSVCSSSSTCGVFVGETIPETGSVRSLPIHSVLINTALQVTFRRIQSQEQGHPMVSPLVDVRE